MAMAVAVTTNAVVCDTAGDADQVSIASALAGSWESWLWQLPEQGLSKDRLVDFVRGGERERTRFAEERRGEARKGADAAYVGGQVTL